MTLSETINRMIESVLQSSTWTSAGGNNPVENFIKEVRGIENPDLEDDLKQALGDSTGGGKTDTSILKSKFKKLEDGNVGELSNFTSQQFGNLKSFSVNPTGFLVGSLFSKFAKGAGVVTLALLIFEAVKFIISELLKPGRLLDIRFKRDIRSEIIAFRLREDQQKLIQGFSRVIITSSPRLRGGQGQTGDSFGDLVKGNFAVTNEPYQRTAPKGFPLDFSKFKFLGPGPGPFSIGG